MCACKCIMLSNLRLCSAAAQAVLIRMGALDADSLTPLPLGLAARGIQGQNELWLALALTHPEVRQLAAC